MKTTIVFLMLSASMLGATLQAQQLQKAPLEIFYRDNLQRLDYFDSLNIWAHDRAVHSLLFGSRIRANEFSQQIRLAHDSLLAYQSELAQMIVDGKDSIVYCDPDNLFAKGELVCQAGYRGKIMELRAQLEDNIRTWNAFVRIYPPIFEHDVTAAEKAEGSELSDDN
jgi:hypothetical protein